MSKEDLEILDMFQHRRDGQTQEGPKPSYYLMECQKVEELERYAKVGKTMVQFGTFIGAAICILISALLAMVLNLQGRWY